MHIPRAIAALGGVAFTVGLIAESAAAQTVFKSGATEVELGGRVQTQFNSTSVTGERESEFLIRRARFEIELTVNDFVSGKVQPEYGEGSVELKDAYLQLNFGPALVATFGQFKRPFDLFELTSSTQILVIERAGKIRGASGCTGPGGVCALSQLTEKLQYSDRDIGVMVEGTDRSTRFGYAVSVTNGAGANVEDENGMKSFTGRVHVSPAKNVRIAGNIGAHDYRNPTLGDEIALAWGGDVEIGNYERGLHVQAGVIGGDNWRNLIGDDPSTFVTAQGIVTYKLPVTGNRFVSGVEPLGRVSWGDPNTDVSDDDGVLWTPGVMVHFVGRNRIAANVDVWSPSQGDTEWSVKVQTYLHF